MKKYIKIRANKKDNTNWYLELDIDKEKVSREIEFDENFNIVRKAPTTEDNYGVWTDNLNVILSDKKPKYKETIVIDLTRNYAESISEEEFEKYWSEPYEYKKKSFWKSVFKKFLFFQKRK